MSQLNKQIWKCQHCRQRNKSTSSLKNAEEDNPQSNQFANKKLQQSNVLIGVSNNNASICNDNEISEMKLEIKNLADTINVLNGTVANLSNLVNNMNNNIKAINDKINILTDENKRKDEQISELEMRLNKLDQQIIENNVEITNIPIQNNKTASEIVIALAKASSVAIDENNDIVDAYSLKNKNKIIVKFSSLNIKRVFMRKVRENNLKTDGIYEKSDNDERQQQRGNVNKSKRIFVNDLLTFNNKKLFWLARNKIKAINWKFVWVKEGKIMAKKDEHSSLMYIKKVSDLENLK